MFTDWTNRRLYDGRKRVHLAATEIFRQTCVETVRHSICSEILENTCFPRIHVANNLKMASQRHFRFEDLILHPYRMKGVNMNHPYLHANQ